jgi:hypothetical protein
MRLQFNRLKDYEARILVDKPYTVLTPHPVEGQRGVFEGDTVRIESAKGEVLRERQDARKAFDGFRYNLWWDDLDSTYFAGYALWNYLTTPFLLRHPDLEVEEITPWEEEGQTWRRLRVRFPKDFPTHSEMQTFYFDPDGLLRRHDYDAKVFGNWAKGAHYCWNHQEFDGILFPTRRRVYARKSSGSFRSWLMLVGLDISDIRVE